MIDARYTAARRTDQSGNRGWAFDEYAEPSLAERLADAAGVLIKAGPALRVLAAVVVLWWVF